MKTTPESRCKMNGCMWCYSIFHPATKQCNDFPIIYAGSYWTRVYLFFYPIFILGTKQLFKFGEMQVRIGRIDRVFFEWELFRRIQLFGKKRKSLQYAQKACSLLEKLSEEMKMLDDVNLYELVITRSGVSLLFTDVSCNMKIVRKKIPVDAESRIKELLKSIADVIE